MSIELANTRDGWLVRRVDAHGPTAQCLSLTEAEADMLATLLLVRLYDASYVDVEIALSLLSSADDQEAA